MHERYIRLWDRAPEIGRRRGPVTVLAVVAMAASALLLTGTPAAAANEPVPVVTDSALSDAIVVEVDPRCSEMSFRSPEAKVFWTVEAAPALKSDEAEALAGATEFRIDYSPYPDGLERGRFESLRLNRDAAPRQTLTTADGSRTEAHASVVRELKPGVYYRARVLIKTEDGWVASSPVGFMSSICPVDGIDEDQE